MSIIANGAARRSLTIGTQPVHRVFLNNVLICHPPIMSTQPTGTTMNDNQSHAMLVSVVGDGTSLQYQWYMDNAVINNATNPQYTFDPSNYYGTKNFKCKIKGFADRYVETVSNSVAVVVRARAPSITTQPVGKTINDNQTHKMSVGVNGHGFPTSFKWYRNGAVISGATGSSYTYKPNGNTNNYNFYCRVSGPQATSQSKTVTITVNASYNFKVSIGRGYPLYIGEVSGFVTAWGFGSVNSGKWADGSTLDYIYAWPLQNTVYIASVNNTKWNGKSSITAKLKDDSTGESITFNMPWSSSGYAAINSTAMVWISNRVGRIMSVSIT